MNYLLHHQYLGSGIVIAPFIGFLESIAISKAFGMLSFFLLCFLIINSSSEQLYNKSNTRTNSSW